MASSCWPARPGREGPPPRFDLLRAIVHYIRAFPEAQHHPKEDAWLFRKLRERTPEFNETLDLLERQHAEGHGLVDELERSVDRYEADPAGGHAQFADAVGRFVTAQESHMRLETRVVLPAAYRHLSGSDWTEIGKAFAENGDPRFSADTDEEFRQLFVRILSLVPEASAAGPPQSADQPGICRMNCVLADRRDRSRACGTTCRITGRPCSASSCPAPSPCHA